MRNILTLLILIFIPLNSFLQSVSMEWLEQYASVGYANFETLEASLDGYIYTTGSFSDSTDFDPSANTDIHVPISTSNAFIQKLNNSGDVIWTVSTGSHTSNGSLNIKQLVVDQNGDLLMTGRYNETIDFDPGINTAFRTSNGSYDFFLLKLSSDGDFLWVKTAGSMAIHDEAKALSIDASGNILITGGFTGTCDFNFGSAVNSLTSAVVSAFILKLNSVGEFIWVKQIESYSSLIPYGINNDSENNIYVAGRYVDSTDFDPDLSTYYAVPDEVTEGFVLKLDSNGVFDWVNTYGVIVTALHVDESDNIFTGGYFSNTENFGNSTADEVTTPFLAGFVQKLNGNGTNVWTKAIHTNSCFTINDIGSTSTGDLAISGVFFALTDFNPSDTEDAIRTPQSTLNPHDGFVLKLDQNGIYQWVKILGFFDGGTVNASAVDENDAIYASGYYYGAGMFGPPFGTINSNGIAQGYVFKIGSTASISEIDDKNFNVFPNPFSSNLLLSFESAKAREISIHSSNGKLILKKEINGIQENLNLDHVESGVYIVTIIDGTAIVTKRIVKM